MKNTHQPQSNKLYKSSNQPSFERERLVSEEGVLEEESAQTPDIVDKLLAPTILAAINQCFDRRVSGRGLTYSRTRRVMDYQFDRATKVIEASVRGSVPEPYEVNLSLSEDCKKVLSTHCTCPIKFDCKHAAAALWSVYGSMQKGGKNSFIAGNDPALLLDASKINAPLRSGLEKIAAIIGTGQKEPDHNKRGIETLVPKATVEHSQVVYILRQDVHGRLVVDALKVFIKADGSFGRARELDIYSPFDSRLRNLDPQDSVIMRLLADAYLAEETRTMGGLPGETSLAETIVNLILATGRVFWSAIDGPPIKAGGHMPGELAWIEDLDGSFRLRSRSVALERKLKTFSGSRFYIDLDSGQLGTLVFNPPVPPSVFDIIDTLAAANKDEIQAVRTLLDSTGMPPVIPRPEGTRQTELRLVQPVPCLWLETKKLPQGTVDIAAFSLNYPDNLSEKHPERFYEEDATGRLIVERIDASAKSRAKKTLHDLGFSIIQNPQDFGLRGSALFLHAHDDATWMRFVCRDRGLLEAQGWEIVSDSSFQKQIIFTEDDASDWGMSVEQEGSVWFEIELGIMVDGRRVSLLPFLEKALKALGPEAKPEDIEASCIDGKFLCPTEKGTILALPYERVKDILQYIFDLDKEMNLRRGKLRLPIMEANEFSKKSTVIPCTGDGALSLKNFDKRLKSFAGLDDSEVTPKDFKGILRDYQKRGVAWLQFLREFQLGGILADDMGLGKTIQTLAHICLEKENGRLDNPFFVICPVSVFPNWLDEAKRFAPHLNILPHRGAGREQSFNKAPGSDIVITTYSVLTRDAALLSKQKWSGIFLDEAQAIKNGGTRNKKAALMLEATHKICLTGTPVENNLGELWSLMDFTMPDILGSAKHFNKSFRAPIEKRHHQGQRQKLAHLLSPFLVRRTKEAVAPELPEKTVIVHRMKLTGGQRDLYEAVRISNLAQVKDAIAAKGLAKSHMIILTAMLRLRQVCCDPRLLNIGSKQNVKESVKLDALMELTLPLVEEGRRILIFSQFTSMLDIIADELKQYNISFVEIRGETKDRRTPVNLFQTGMVPVFLISLKAGGTGLNLTAADTVIHYDPWWNPAVEDQATDRAHRIGQNKPVFVYKLVTTETIEDRMREMQEKKRLLYQAILDGDKNATIAFTEKDLDLLFAPLAELLDFGEDG